MAVVPTSADKPIPVGTDDHEWWEELPGKRHAAWTNKVREWEAAEFGAREDGDHFEVVMSSEIPKPGKKAYEYMRRAKATMQLVIPTTLALIFLLLYFNFKSVGETMIVMLSLPFALVGGIWFIWCTRLQLVGRCGDWLHRARWRRSRNRGRDADISRSCVGCAAR